VSGFELDRVNNILVLVYFHTKVADDETAQAELFTRMDRWGKDCRAISVETYRLNRTTLTGHTGEDSLRTCRRAGQNLPCGSRYWDAPNADLWMIGLSTSTSESSVGSDKLSIGIID
jgi:hypothetical protein